MQNVLPTLSGREKKTVVEVAMDFWIDDASRPSIKEHFLFAAPEVKSEIDQVARSFFRRGRRCRSWRRSLFANDDRAEGTEEEAIGVTAPLETLLISA